MAHLRGLGPSGKGLGAGAIFVSAPLECSSVGKYLCDSWNAAELMSQYASRGPARSACRVLLQKSEEKAQSWDFCQQRRFQRSMAKLEFLRISRGGCDIVQIKLFQDLVLNFSPSVRLLFDCWLSQTAPCVTLSFGWLICLFGTVSKIT